MKIRRFLVALLSFALVYNLVVTPAMNIVADNLSSEAVESLETEFAEAGNETEAAETESEAAVEETEVTETEGEFAEKAEETAETKAVEAESETVEAAEIKTDTREIYEQLMACTEFEVFLEILSTMTEESRQKMTEEEIAAINAHGEALEPEPLPAVVIESEPPVMSVIVYETVNFDHVAPFVDAE